jgi:hypothetical protein
MYNTMCAIIYVNNTIAYLSKIANLLYISTNSTGARSQVAALLQQRQDCTHASCGSINAHAVGLLLGAVNGTMLSAAARLS